jgi:outer membrane protein insertion porin family/translocation and assembly module TamA
MHPPLAQLSGWDWRPRLALGRLLHWCCVTLACVLGTSCGARKPALGPRIDRIELRGADSISTDDLLQGLATEPASLPAVLGLAKDEHGLDEALLTRDLERIERFYRARGYYEARVDAARVIWTGAHSARIEIAVSEGEPVAIASAPDGRLAVQLSGLDSLRDATTVAQIIAACPRPGELLDEDAYERAKVAIRRTLADHGYAFARVTGQVDVDLAHHSAQLRFEIEAGPHAVFGAIAIVGLESIPEDKVRYGLLLQPGDDYSASAVEDARRSLVNLGVFSTVAVDADTHHPESGRVPLTFTLREAAPRTVRLGGGARLDAVELSGNLTASWEHRNFLGGLRHLTLEARPGLVLFPTRMADFPNLSTPNRALFEGALEARLAQPSFLEGRTKGFASTSLEVQPLLDADTPPDAVLIGFLELAARAGLERPFLSHRLFVTLSLNWLAELPLDYRQLTLGRQSPPAQAGAVEKLYIAYPDLTTRLDLRDDPLDPKRGLLLANSLQLALPALGSSVSDLRIAPEARFYVTKSRVTLALRATTGLLFPRNYGHTAADPSPSTVDQQILLFRGFFSGGPSSNRGYAFQGVGRRSAFLISDDPGVPCSTVAPESLTDPRCLRPVGGLTSWEMSAELRFPIRFVAPLGGVLFVDASDVEAGRAQYRFDRPHLAPGVGLRYPTPIGPVRLDLGFRLLEALGKEHPEGTPPTLLGAPLTLQLAIGQAF